MNASQIVNYLERITGIEGCCISTTDGEVIEKFGSEIMDEAMFREVVIEGSHLLETLQEGLEGCREVQLNFELKKILIRSLGDLLLVIIVDEQIRMNDIRVAANIVSKRFSTTQAGDPGQRPASPASEEKAASFFSFGQKAEQKPKIKPRKDDSIWG